MILLKVSLFALLILMQAYGMAQQSGREIEAQRQLSNGLADNDNQAFEAVSKLPINEAAPLLLIYVDDASTNVERAGRAREILRKMPGFSEYMKQRLLEKRSQPGGEYEMEEFRMLRAVGGDEAAAAVAPFLFVDDPPLMVADDYSAGPIRYDALSALMQMHLTDAPKGGLEEWKAWAQKKGYQDVKIPPLMTLQQKGVPPGAIARSEAILAGARAFQTIATTPAPDSVQHRTPAPTELSSTPLKKAALGTSSQIPAATVEPMASVWLWIVGIAAVTVIALLVWKRRGR